MLRRLGILLLLVSSLLLIDFLTKWVVYHAPFLPLPIFKNFCGIDFFINITFNRGAAFGLLSHYQVPLLLFRILIILFLFIIALQKNKRRFFLPLSFIIAGAMGNVMDYFIYGYVIDFLDFRFFGHGFPLFNVADIAISLGIVFLLVFSYFGKKIYEHSQVD